MDSSVWLGLSTVFATLMGPILAVQAQKFVERRRAQSDQKMRVFSTLMATRAARLSPDHVQALNMIDLAFNGGGNRRRKGETEVLEAWRDYLDHLNSPLNDSNAELWHEKQADFLIKLLSAMASDLGLKYDRVLLRNGAYLPTGHMNIELEQHRFRQLAIKVLAGESAIEMNVAKFALDPVALEAQVAVQNSLTKILSGERSLGVHMEPKTPASVDSPN